MPENEITSKIAYNGEAERAVLGACLLAPEAVDATRELLRAADFYDRRHQIIFSAVCDLQDASRPCDLVTLGEVLRDTDELSRVGGAAYVASLLDAVPAPSAARHYAAIVAENSQIRTLQATLRENLARTDEGGLSARELIEAAEKSIYDISQQRRRGELYSLTELLTDQFVQMSKIRDTGGVTGVPTFSDLDTHYLSGLQKGDLVLLAARPGCGKTSMAVNIAQNATAKHGKVAAIFSLEMPKEQLVQRMLCTQAQVDHSRVRKGMASRGDFARLQKAVTELSGAQLYIDDSMSVTPSEMRSKCRKLKSERGLDLVVVDYIQLMQAGGARRAENRQLEVTEISRSLKELAKELDVPVLALSQLKREAESSKEPPGLSHLRESGSLEQDADVVIMLYQKKTEDGAPGAEDWKQSNAGEPVDVMIAKHRNGATGVVRMMFIKQYTMFANNAENWAGSVPPDNAYQPD